MKYNITYVQNPCGYFFGALSIKWPTFPVCQRLTGFPRHRIAVLKLGKLQAS